MLTWQIVLKSFGKQLQMLHFPGMICERGNLLAATELCTRHGMACRSPWISQFKPFRSTLEKKQDGGNEIRDQGNVEGDWKVNILVMVAPISSSTIRYNPENIKTLEHYVDLQSREKGNSYLSVQTRSRSCLYEWVITRCISQMQGFIYMSSQRRLGTRSSLALRWG